MKNFTDAFVKWVRQNRNRLEVEGVAVEMPDQIVGNGTYAYFSTGKGKETKEVMVEIWDYGFSEFHVADPQAEQVTMTHHEFQEFDELYAALDQIVSRLSLVPA